jgi:hypothetical protein
MPRFRRQNLTKRSLQILYARRLGIIRIIRENFEQTAPDDLLWFD